MTMDLECAVITQVLACKTVTGACSVLRLGWDQVRGVMERAVEQGLARRADDEVTYISIVMTLQRAARGYRTWRTLRRAILFYCGGLALYPTRRIAACL